jgi:sec-independent protein translocase protein TatC
VSEGRSKTGSPDKLTMLDHVKELRLRLFLCVAVLVAGGVLGYFFYETILFWLKSPLLGDLYYTTPAGSFNFIMKVSALVGIAAVIPVAIYQMMMFIRPALKKGFSKLRITGFTTISVLLAAAGAAFAFYLILPGALNFFAGFQVEGLSALIGADSYLSFVTNVIITFMIVFQIPLLLVIIDHVKPIQPQKLFKAEKYVILGGLLVSFFVPFALDLVTSLLIALPIVALYNISIGVIIWRHALLRQKKARTVVEKQEELALDDALIADFFAQKSELVNPEPVSDEGGLKGFAMDFKRSRQNSIEELRLAIERDRAQAIAEKVARYNAGQSFRQITDIR